MLRQALQSSAPVTPPVISQPTPQATPNPATPVATQPAATSQGQPQQRTIAQTLIGWAPQLRQMRELGITDDIVAIQALEATNGDVQAAINIIFSDFN